MNSSKNRPLTAILNRLPAAPHYWVAYSGGIDSHVLLHLLAAGRDRLPGTLAAVHVNHQIQAASGDWEQHCRATCEELGVAFHTLRVQGRARRGESPEAAARVARYRALADWLPPQAVLLSAQHRDDQAETLLLQLLRGAGPKGLAAMPAQAPLGAGRLVRPFLAVERAAILAYAQRHRLRWVEDPSNTDIRYQRNLLRQRIMPELRQHWPGLSTVLARAAAHQADQLELADAMAALDAGRCVSGAHNRLSLPEFATLSAARQRNLLRYWIEQNSLPLPSQAVVQRLRDEMLSPRSDACPLVHWSGAEVRRYRTALYLMPPLPAHDPRVRVTRALEEPFRLEIAAGVLTAHAVQGAGLHVAQGTRIDIAFRQGGEHLQPAGRAHRHALKKLFQEWGVPPWERERVPLVYVDNTLAAVAGFCVAQAFSPQAGQSGYLLRWSRTASLADNSTPRD